MIEPSLPERALRSSHSFYTYEAHSSTKLPIFKTMLVVFIFYRLIIFFRVYNATKCHFYQAKYEC